MDERTRASQMLKYMGVGVLLGNMIGVSPLLPFTGVVIAVAIVALGIFLEPRQ